MIRRYLWKYRRDYTLGVLLSTIVGADRILVLHHGRLAEEGTHPPLLRRDGMYAGSSFFSSPAGRAAPTRSRPPRFGSRVSVS